VLPCVERHGPIEAWIIDDTSFPEDIEFQTKPKIALQRIEWACAAGIPRPCEAWLRHDASL